MLLPSNGTDNVCLSQECRTLVNQFKIMPRDQNSQCYFQQQAARIKKKKAIDEAHRLRIKQIDQQEEEEDQKTFQAITSKSQLDTLSEAINYYSIPSGKSKLTPLSQARIDEYKKHLQKVIDEAFSDPPIVDFFDQEQTTKAKSTQAALKSNPAVQKFISQCCSLCKGGCCTAGNNTGIISLETIKQASAHFNCNNPETLLSMYLEKLPTYSVKDSCINQGPEGCVLPPTMRSATCNGYYCESLKSLINQSDNNVLDPSIVFQRAYDRWSKYDENTDHSIKKIFLIENDQIKDL